jgi:hypothetical protein
MQSLRPEEKTNQRQEKTRKMYGYGCCGRARCARACAAGSWRESSGRSPADAAPLPEEGGVHGVDLSMRI